MLAISASELANLQREFNSTFPDLATVLRPSRQSNGRGGWTTTYVAQPAQVPCIVTAQKAGSRSAKHIENEEEVAVTTWVIKVPQGANVQVTDRLQVSGSTYEIFDTLTAHRSLQIALILYCRVIE